MSWRVRASRPDRWPTGKAWPIPPVQRQSRPQDRQGNPSERSPNSLKGLASTDPLGISARKRSPAVAEIVIVMGRVVGNSNSIDLTTTDMQQSVARPHQRGSRGANSALTHARNRCAQADPARRSSSSTHRSTSSDRTGKNSLLPTEW